MSLANSWEPIDRRVSCLSVELRGEPHKIQDLLGKASRERVGIVSVDETLARFGHYAIRVPFRGAAKYETPSVRRLACVFEVCFDEPVESGALEYALLQLDAVARVEVPVSRSASCSSIFSPAPARLS